MTKYDGPSFYKKDHPKIEPIKENRFKNPYKKSMPNKMRTRKDVQKDAKNYMETPSDKTSPGKYTFRNKYIPTSMQNLEGWQHIKKNDALISEIQQRLAKEKDSYLLIDEYLVEPMKIETPKPKQKAMAKPKAKTEPNKSKAERVQEKMTSNLKAPNAGLHRSLSKIIAEDQEAIKNGKNNLNSLFSEKK